MKASEMDCHRLKAILAGTMMKCIRKPAFGKVFEYEKHVSRVKGFEWYAYYLRTIRVVTRSLNASPLESTGRGFFILEGVIYYAYT